MTNISGNFSTANREVYAVQKILNDNNIAYQSVTKYNKPDDGDILVILANGRQFVVEVKEEDRPRFKKYGQLGIDFISAFHYINPASASSWKGVKSGSANVKNFLASVDMTNNYKGGKIYYSKSHLWLFFVMDNKNNFVYYDFFDGQFMTSQAFKNYLFTNCQFAVNNKPFWQMSNSDNYNSAVFYINHNDATLHAHRVDITAYCV